MICYLLKNHMHFVKMLQNVAFIVFAIAYLLVVLKLLLQKQIHFYKMMRTYHIFLWLFVFLLLTNYNTWYCLWLFPNVLFIKGKAVKRLLYLATGSQIAMQSTFLYLGERQNLGLLFLLILIGVVVTMQLSETLQKRRKLKQR